MSGFILIFVNQGGRIRSAFLRLLQPGHYVEAEVAEVSIRIVFGTHGVGDAFQTSVAAVYLGGADHGLEFFGIGVLNTHLQLVAGAGVRAFAQELVGVVTCAFVGFVEGEISMTRFVRHADGDCAAGACKSTP